MFRNNYTRTQSDRTRGADQNLLQVPFWPGPSGRGTIQFTGAILWNKTSPMMRCEPCHAHFCALTKASKYHKREYWMRTCTHDVMYRCILYMIRFDTRGYILCMQKTLHTVYMTDDCIVWRKRCSLMSRTPNVHNFLEFSNGLEVPHGEKKQGQLHNWALCKISIQYALLPLQVRRIDHSNPHCVRTVQFADDIKLYISGRDKHQLERSMYSDSLRSDYVSGLLVITRNILSVFFLQLLITSLCFFF